MPTTPVPCRLLVDGVPQPSFTIDTTQWLDGTHVLGVQVMDQLGQSISNGSRVVVINNSGTPFTSLDDQAVISHGWLSSSGNSLAWGRVDVQPTPARPLDLELDKHPVATTDADRVRLATEKIWWVEGLSHQPTGLWLTMPIVVKNRDFDLFILQHNPQGGGSGVTPINALPYVEQGPAYDGPRGIGTLSPYASLSPHPRVLAFGQTGFVGVEKSGRVLWVDLTGEITTILGPRSVAGVPGTDPNDFTVTLADRLANGEKEYIGDDNGLPLKMPHDIWPCNLFPFEGVIADTGNDRVAEIQFYPTDAHPEAPRLMRSWSLPGVTSVWASKEFQEDPTLNVIWFAVNPEGLWCQRHTTGSPGMTDGVVGGLDGSFTGHEPELEKLADIPEAFWVRGHGTRVYVLTSDLGVYEYNISDGSLMERKPREQYKEQYCFMAVDDTGAIGPIGRLYWGCTGTGNWVYRKTTIQWLNTNDWSTGIVGRGRLLNNVLYTNWTAMSNPLGHYMWGIAIHPTLPKFLACGITSSSWFLWTGCLGELPAPDPRSPYAGDEEWWYGKPDQRLGLSAIYGCRGHGDVGFSCDEWREYMTWGEAREVVRARLDPMFHPELTEQEKEDVAKTLFEQRTRKHFADASD